MAFTRVVRLMRLQVRESIVYKSESEEDIERGSHDLRRKHCRRNKRSTIVL